MKNKIKKVLIVLLLASITLQVVGCKQTKKEEPKPTEKYSEQLDQEQD